MDELLYGAIGELFLLYVITTPVIAGVIRQWSAAPTYMAGKSMMKYAGPILLLVAIVLFILPFVAASQRSTLLMGLGAGVAILLWPLSIVVGFSGLILIIRNLEGKKRAELRSLAFSCSACGASGVALVKRCPSCGKELR